MTGTITVRAHKRKKPVNLNQEALHKRLAMELQVKRNLDELDELDRLLSEALGPSNGGPVDADLLREWPELDDMMFRQDMGMV